MYYVCKQLIVCLQTWILARTAQTTKVFSPVLRFLFGYWNMGLTSGVVFWTPVTWLKFILNRSLDPSAPDPCLSTTGKFGGKTSHGRGQTPLHGPAHAQTDTLIHVHAPCVPPAHPTDDVFVLDVFVAHVRECFDVKLLPADPRVGNEAFVVPQVHHFLPPVTDYPIDGILVSERPKPNLHTGKSCVQT